MKYYLVTGKLSLFINHLIIPVSTAEMCKSCAKYGKTGTNEAYNIKIKISIGSILEIFCVCSDTNMAASDKGIITEEESP